MIRGLRERHRRIVMVVAVAVPIAFAAGLLLRHPIAESEALPPSLAAPAVDESQFLSTRSKDSGRGIAVSASALRSTDGSTFRVAIEVIAESGYPELLIYWSADSAEPGQALPDDARLLGSPGSSGRSVFDLPQDAAKRDGHLLVYSLARQELMETLRLPAATTSGVAP